MIPYSNGSFGLWLLTRVHGSALYKSLLPTVISTVMYFVIAHAARKVGTEEDVFEVFIHPYPMNALVTAFTFLLVFRANYRLVSQTVSGQERQSGQGEYSLDRCFVVLFHFSFSIHIYIAITVGGRLTQQCISCIRNG